MLSGYITNFIIITLNVIWAYVLGSQSDVDYWSSAFRDWWNGFWGLIQTAVNTAYNAIVNWVKPWFDWLDDWSKWAADSIADLWTRAAAVLEQANNYAVQLWQDLVARIVAAVQPAFDVIANLERWINEQLSTYVYPNINWLLNQINSAWVWITTSAAPWIDYLYSIHDRFDYLFRDAYQIIQSFILDPLAFVLGALLAPLLWWVNLYRSAWSLLTDFFTHTLPELQNLWETAAADIQEFFSDPLKYTFDRAAAWFVDWLMDLIESNW
jgi:hypothetical protein